MVWFGWRLACAYGIDLISELRAVLVVNANINEREVWLTGGLDRMRNCFEFNDAQVCVYVCGWVCVHVC